MKQTKGNVETASKQYVLRSVHQQTLLFRIDQLEMPGLSYSTRRALREAFVAGAQWERIHVRNGTKEKANAGSQDTRDAQEGQA